MIHHLAERIDQFRWRVPPVGEMRTECRVIADADLMEGISSDRALEQGMGVATLPGIVGPSLIMPDGHQGYGFPIGGVAAFDPAEGVVSPGGVGYDINCGVRLMRSKLAADDLPRGELSRLADALAGSLPVGIGKGGGVKVSDRELDQVLVEGSAWAVGRGLGQPSDLEFCESAGALPGARPEALSPRARERGISQVGTLGSGNHFVELARVDEVYDAQAAEAFGLDLGALVVWIHSGSRGLGHQVCDDYLRRLGREREAIHPQDRQLVAASPGSAVGRDYLAAMAAAANFAFANRQVLTHRVRETLMQALGLGPAALGLGLVYDVAHNVVKQERHTWEGRQRELLVHRKGATRAFGPGHPELPARYAAVGQPVLLPGDMGRFSYVLAGSASAMAETFGSAAHGAGRALSRTAAKKRAKGRAIDAELAAAGIQVRAGNRATLAEEMPEAYKDAAQVVKVLHGAGIAPKVVRTRPLAVVKG